MKEKNAIKNRISALESRLKKRQETKKLNSEVDHGESQFESVISVLDRAFKGQIPNLEVP